VSDGRFLCWLTNSPILRQHFSVAGSVKDMYKTEGDLGSLAMTLKSKQRTLSFGIKPKALTAELVIKTFREIANIAGSKSQLLKVNLIKKMLVAAQEPVEAKYIIRGLQGKLRIGLAQSTVLTSLAHALAFTLPSTVEETTILEKAASIGENDSDEEGDSDKDDDKNVTVFQDDSAPIEKRLEAAVNIVKQVYSEVPSYDAFLDAALKVPLVALPDACAFQPGIPVVPMLAKPTKSIQGKSLTAAAAVWRKYCPSIRVVVSPFCFTYRGPQSIERTVIYVRVQV
jgi:DNA ligase-1